MAEIPTDVKRLLFGRGAKHHAWVSVVCASLSMICFVVGIIGDIANRTPLLQPTNWFLLGIGIGLLGLFAWICSYFAAKEG